ncbi:MAG: hypothetical protein HY738_24130 [Bacteroidia bacterium]|nr:hypothetical protein [Bacteroidia bacterium]
MQLKNKNTVQIKETSVREKAPGNTHECSIQNNIKKESTMKHTIEEAVESLLRKGCRITEDEPKYVDVSRAVEIGNGSWGRIEYLVRYCGYILSGFVLVKL